MGWIEWSVKKMTDVDGPSPLCPALGVATAQYSPALPAAQHSKVEGTGGRGAGRVWISKSKQTAWKFSSRKVVV